MIFLISFKPNAFESKKKLKAVDCQFFQDGRPIRTDFTVQSERDKLNHYPEGTVFYTDDLVDENVRYSALEIHPVLQVVGNTDCLIDEYFPGDGPASEEVKMEWTTLRRQAFQAAQGNRTSSARGLLNRLRAASPCPTVDTNGFWIKPSNWDTILINTEKKVPTLLIGPTGTGKTQLVQEVAKVFNLPIKQYDMGAMQDPMAQLLGTHRIGNGNSRFDYADFVYAIQQPGIILLDELSRAPVMTNNILFPVLDNRRELRVDMAGENDVRSVKVHPGCMFFATANIGAEYVGTMSIDRALMSRFFPIELDYLPAEEEANLLVKRTECTLADARLIVKHVRSIRKMYSEGSLSNETSVRDSIRCAWQIACGQDRNVAFEQVFLPLFDRDERSLVKQIFQQA